MSPTVNAGDKDESIQRGLQYIAEYPFPEPQILFPYYGLNNFFTGNIGSSRFFRKLFGFNTIDGFYSWLGHDPSLDSSDIILPKNNSHYPLPIGLYAIETRRGSVGVTFNCATCHTGSIFGKNITGLPNRMNKMFQFSNFGDKSLHFMNRYTAQFMLGLEREDAIIMNKARKTNYYTDSIRPQAKNIDTSVAQIIASLHKRRKDKYATKKFTISKPVPRYVKYENVKIQPWWNFKYKSRFMVDGSLTKGDFLDFLVIVGEIMFGGDLIVADKWLADNINQNKLDDIRDAILSTKAPKYRDYFPFEVNMKNAKAGLKIYKNNCANCHGDANFNNDKLEYIYDAHSKPMDVGTVSRQRTMTYMKKLISRLEVVKKYDIELTPAKGFLATPLEGVWVNFPYLHNGSVHSLCELLTPPKHRKKSYTFSKVESLEEYDKDCLGYAQKVSNKFKYNNKKRGLSNRGHDYGTDLPSTDKQNLIEFLKIL